MRRSRGRRPDHLHAQLHPSRCRARGRPFGQTHPAGKADGYHHPGCPRHHAARAGSSGRFPDRPAVSLQTDLRRSDPRGAGAQDHRRHQDHQHPGASLPVPGQGEAVEQVLEILRRHAGGEVLPLLRPDEPVRGRQAGQCVRHRQRGGQLPGLRVRGREVGHPGQRLRGRHLRQRRPGQLQPVHVRAHVLRGAGAVRRRGAAEGH